MKKYNHAFTIAFTVENTSDGESVTEKELFTGIKKRVIALSRNEGEIIEACGMPFDTYEIEEK